MPTAMQCPSHFSDKVKGLTLEKNSHVSKTKDLTLIKNSTVPVTCLSVPS